MSEILKIISERYECRDLMKDMSEADRYRLIGKLELIEELESLIKEIEDGRRTVIAE